MLANSSSLSLSFPHFFGYLLSSMKSERGKKSADKKKDGEKKEKKSSYVDLFGMTGTHGDIKKSLSGFK
jgi:hypothetical protein